jgi:hypothetical protein
VYPMEAGCSPCTLIKKTLEGFFRVSYVYVLYMNTVKSFIKRGFPVAVDKNMSPGYVSECSKSKINFAECYLYIYNIRQHFLSVMLQCFEV